MPYYCVSTVKGDKGEHNVHTTSCNQGSATNHRKDLGYHTDCKSAVNSAKSTYPTADGCFYCCEPCHNK